MQLALHQLVLISYGHVGNLINVILLAVQTIGLARPSIPFADIQKVMENLASVNNDRRCHFWEIFSRPRIAPVCRELGMRSLRSIDVSWPAACLYTCLCFHG